MKFLNLIKQNIIEPIKINSLIYEIFNLIYLIEPQSQSCYGISKIYFKSDGECGIMAGVYLPIADEDGMCLCDEREIIEVSCSESEGNLYKALLLLKDKLKLKLKDIV